VFEQFAGAALASCELSPAMRPRIPGFATAQLLVDRQFLRHHAHDAFGPLWIGPERRARDNDFTGIGLSRPRSLKCGGLARAVGPSKP